jgi:hypothetical protein
MSSSGEIPIRCGDIASYTGCSAYWKDARWDRVLKDAGTLGRWDAGTLGRWDAGTLGRWDAGTLVLEALQLENDDKLSV